MEHYISAEHPIVQFLYSPFRATVLRAAVKFLALDELELFPMTRKARMIPGFA